MKLYMHNNRVFKSIAELSKYLNKDHASIHRAIRNNWNFAGYKVNIIEPTEEQLKQISTILGGTN